MSKRVCLISLNLSGGGAQRVLLNQAEMFVDGGYNVDIIIMKNKVDYDYDDVYNVHFLSNTRYISNNKLLNLFLFYERMVDLINSLEKSNGRFDLFLSHSYDSDQLIKFLKRENKFSVIHGTMSNYLKNWHFLKRHLYKLVYKNEQICAVSKGVKDDLLSAVGIKPKLINVINNPFNIDRIKHLSNEPTYFDNDYILFVGSINKIKRLDVLLKGYKRSNILQQLVILGGDDNYSEYFQMVQKITEDLGLQTKVKFINFVKNPYPFIKNAKLLVLSSDHEGLPTVLIEALILDTMVVSTNCESGPSEILTGVLSNYLAPVGDYKALGDKINKAVNNPIAITDKFYRRYDQRVIFNHYKNLIGEG